MAARRLFGILLAVTAGRLHAQNQWARADSATERLVPSRFHEMPVAVRRDLEGRGCRVPQVPGPHSDEKPHNVIVGAFTAAGRHDWAVLCSISGVSRILVYRRGETAVID